MLVTIGPRDYHARAQSNLQEWESLLRRMQYDPFRHTLAVDVSPTGFIRYAIRAGWLREIPT